MHAHDTIDSDASLQNPQQWLLISCCRQNCIIIVCCYIRQGSYVLPLCVCLSVCLSVAMHHLISGINFLSQYACLRYASCLNPKVGDAAVTEELSAVNFNSHLQVYSRTATTSADSDGTPPAATIITPGAWAATASSATITA